MAVPGPFARPRAHRPGFHRPAPAHRPYPKPIAARESPMPTVTMKQLLEAGVHFGHQTRRWNPKMRRYIFGERDGIHIIDLLQTERAARAGLRRRRATSPQRGGTVLFVGTKKQAQDAVAGVGRALRHAVRQPALARRPADQLQHDLPADPPPARAAQPEARGPARAAADQGADGDARPSSRSSSPTSAASPTWSGCPTRSSSST